MLETAKNANSCSKSLMAICWQIISSKLKTMYLHVVDFVQPVKNNNFSCADRNKYVSVLFTAMVQRCA